MIKNLPASVGDSKDIDWIPGLGRAPGEGNGNLLEYSSLEDSMDRRAWQVTVHGAPGSDTSEHTSSTFKFYI